MPTIAIHRIGRAPDPRQYPDWSRANPDRTFGNRFDDPNGEYRVLYASSMRRGCFLETLARYRPDLDVYAALRNIDGEDDFVPAGIVPREWLSKRMMGSANADGKFADIGTSEWLSILRRDLAPLLINLGIPDVDGSVLQRTAPRILTQNISEVVYRRGFNGIRYLSKYGNDIENWALFEPSNLTCSFQNSIQPDDPDLLEALRLFDLTIN